MLILFIKDSDEDASLCHIDIGILLVESEGAVPSSSLHLSTASLKIIVEGEIVIHNLQDLPKAMWIQFDLSYALHLNYHKTMTLTLQFIQQVFLMLGHSDLKPRLQIINNQLEM